MKTEHSGPKNGGSGYYGHHSDAKIDCNSQRRINDKLEIRDQLQNVVFDVEIGLPTVLEKASG